jgi:cell division protein FtsL
VQYLKYVPKPNLPNILTSIGYLYKHTNPEKAKYYLKKSLSEAESSYAFAHLSDIYIKEGKIDEAYLLRKKALTINDNNPKDIILHNLLEYDMEHCRTDSVCLYVNEIIAIKDSIINNLRNDTIKDLQLRFDHEVAMRKQETITSNWQKGLLVAFLLISLLVAYIIIKRYRERIKMQETQMQINDLMIQIRELEKSEEDNSIAIQKLNDQIKDKLNKEGPLLKQGKILYDQIQDGKTVVEWRKKDFELFNNYYKAIDYKTVNRLVKIKRQEKLTPQKLFFLLLNEMGYNKKDIARIFSIEETSVNTLYFRTKPIE